MRQFELTCFGTRPGEGNPALVLLDDTRGVAERQHFTHASGRAACVFVDAGCESAAFTLDFYYPHARSPLCLHATLAAARVLLDTAPGPLAVHTALHGQRLVLRRRGDDVFIELAPQPAPTPALTAELVARLVPGIDIVSTPGIASVGSPKLLLEVRDAAALRGLRPDLAAIAAWGKEAGVNGCYAWCRRAAGSLEGRNFNHLDPALEDSATGVAAGALTVLLGQALTLYQGANVGRPCLLRTSFDDGRVLLGGAAHHLQRD